MSAAVLDPNSISMLSDTSETHVRTPQKKSINLLMAGAIATVITLALFCTMEYLIRIDAINMQKAKDFTLRAFTVETIPPPAPSSYLDIEIIKTPIPPAAPAISITASDAPSLNIPIINNSAPDLVSQIPVIATGTYNGPSTAIPIRQPLPTYPRKALHQGLSGLCDVAFALDPQGRPFNVVADCSDAVFNASAERAVRKALFSPTKDASGVPVTTYNMVFPLEYKYAE
ncbi:energy transducer TonB [Hirschia baltica]|nr:energy transducer TonB [Hirschia baltica]